MVFYRLPFVKGYFSVDFGSTYVDSNKVRNCITSCLGSSDFVLHHNGRPLSGVQEIHQDATVLVTFSLPGGKGGFGSMLRAIGAQIEKTTNREACRDLSGRRLRDINEEQRLKKWIAKESEREADKIRRRRERIERLKAKPKHNFVDFEYEKEISQLPERIDDALNAGMQKASKRPSNDGEASTSTAGSKKKCLWLGDDISDSSSSDSESQDVVSSSESATAVTSVDESQEAIPKISSSDADGSNSSNSGYSIVSKSVEETAEVSSSSHAGFSGDTDPVVVKSVGSSESNSSADSKEVTADPKLDNPTPLEKADEVQVPIDLLDFETIADLESLGLDRLKSALMARGLKCGGNISDRAQRLWKVRGLQPHEYPSNLLAKKK